MDIVCGVLRVSRRENGQAVQKEGGLQREFRRFCVVTATLAMTGLCFGSQSCGREKEPPAIRQTQCSSEPKVVVKNSDEYVARMASETAEVSRMLAKSAGHNTQKMDLALEDYNRIISSRKFKQEKISFIKDLVGRTGRNSPFAIGILRKFMEKDKFTDETLDGRLVERLAGYSSHSAW